MGCWWPTPAVSASQGHTQHSGQRLVESMRRAGVELAPAAGSKAALAAAAEEEDDSGEEHYNDVEEELAALPGSDRATPGSADGDDDHEFPLGASAVSPIPPHLAGRGSPGVVLAPAAGTTAATAEVQPLRLDPALRMVVDKPDASSPNGQAGGFSFFGGCCRAETSMDAPPTSSQHHGASSEWREPAAAVSAATARWPRSRSTSQAGDGTPTSVASSAGYTDYNTPSSGGSINSMDSYGG